ncbi:MAG: type II secretion system protein [Gammaproteobacteria bacterium]|nr:type II secretion system protein [Gammaproteobacteria bacterium]
MSSKGFTLIETLVSLVIFLLIAAGVAYGLQRVISGNIYVGQRQDVINTTLGVLDQSRPPLGLCPPPGSSTTMPATTPTGLQFTITITCAVDAVPMLPGSQNLIDVTQLTAVASWSTFGVSRHVTVYE